MKIKLGDLLEKIIMIVTLGQGKRIATYVAKRFFDMEDCGCDKRKKKLNEFKIKRK